MRSATAQSSASDNRTPPKPDRPPARRRRSRPSPFRIWFKVGSQNDPPGKEGLAAITAAMLAEGLDARTTLRTRFSTSCFRWPPAIRRRPAVEMTVISGRVHKDNLGRLLSAVDRGDSRARLPAGRPRPDQEPNAQLPGKHAALLQRRGVGQGGALQHDLRRHALRPSARRNDRQRPQASRWTTCRRSTASTTPARTSSSAWAAALTPATGGDVCGGSWRELSAGIGRRVAAAAAGADPRPAGDDRRKGRVGHGHQHRLSDRRAPRLEGLVRPGGGQLVARPASQLRAAICTR